MVAKNVQRASQKLLHWDHMANKLQEMKEEKQKKTQEDLKAVYTKWERAQKN